ncbi:endosome-associated-trafficking regulator 1 [Pristis pectinata]|uniref:endosome-associated-trafficking regulator 1 n=1 Tax=Pristis pectinata TaxID=685728 RepID=UPI00223CDF2D|nr:endosome-associated-trafficking regulator 1 [Pristis pectinata]
MSSRGERGEKEKDDEETNPFSFKEFVKIKSRSTTKGEEMKNQQLKDSIGIAFEGGLAAPKELNLKLNFPEGYFPDPMPNSPSLDEEDDDWSETYQPAIIEAAHEFGISNLLQGVSHAPLTLSPTDPLHYDSAQYAPSEWQVDDEEEEEEEDHSKGSAASQLDPSLDSHDPPKDHFDLVGEVLYQSQLLSNEKLKEENALLRRQTKEAKQLAKNHVKRTRKLEEELERRKIKEEKEARALEAMVQQVEENLQLMTKRAVKAENTVTKLRQELATLQAELQQCKSENERLRSQDSAALNSAKNSARLASDYLMKTAHEAEASVKQLMSGAETLRLAAELLKSIDRISELPPYYKMEDPS